MNSRLDARQPSPYASTLPIPPRERSDRSLCTSFQSLTNCLKFATLSEPLCFLSLPTVKFCNSFLLITIQNARGGLPTICQAVGEGCVPFRRAAPCGAAFEETGWSWPWRRVVSNSV